MMVDGPARQDAPLDPPRAFLSHASADKERFVLSFATRLRERGVDVWLDKWEMLPGDSLVDKIFEEGIAAADAMIVVLSRHSVASRWVREEMNAGFVARVQQRCRLIPVVIDDCEVPVALQATVWERIPDLRNYDEQLAHIVQAIFGTRTRPPVGRSPGYTEAKLNVLPGLTGIDTLLLKAAGDLCVQSEHDCVETTDLASALTPHGISASQIEDAIEILDGRYYVKALRVLAGAVPSIRVLHRGFEAYFQAFQPDYDNCVSRVCYRLVNDGRTKAGDIAETLDLPITLVNHVLEDLSLRRLIRLSEQISGARWVVKVEAELKRRLQ